MASPHEPEPCRNTGRLLTEWFEFPEYTDEQLFEMGCEDAGISPEEFPKGMRNTLSPESRAIFDRVTKFARTRKNTKFVNGMSRQEVQHRMNEASKMVDPSNMKFLPDHVRERTGLEINPLWMMECLIRSGTLSHKDQLSGLKELAAYTHSKAPSISHNTHTKADPEDWLLELAKDEYEVVDDMRPETVQPRQRREVGLGKDYELRRSKKIAEVQQLDTYSAEELAALEAEFDDWEEPDPDV